jgi:hypothetical protein
MGHDVGSVSVMITVVLVVVSVSHGMHCETSGRAHFFKVELNVSPVGHSLTSGPISEQ